MQSYRTEKKEEGKGEVEEKLLRLPAKTVRNQAGDGAGCAL